MKGAEECDDGNTLDGDGCSSTCTLEVPDYTITHTGNNGDGLRWNLGNGGFLVEDVPSLDACAVECSTFGGFNCVGFSYKFNGTYFNPNAQDGLKDKDCFLLFNLQVGNTGIDDILSCTLN